MSTTAVNRSAAGGPAAPNRSAQGSRGPADGGGPAAEVPADLRRVAGPDHQRAVACGEPAAAPAGPGRGVRGQHHDAPAGPPAAHRRRAGRRPARQRHLRGGPVRVRPGPPAQLRRRPGRPGRRDQHPAAGHGDHHPACGGRGPARRPRPGAAAAPPAAGRRRAPHRAASYLPLPLAGGLDPAHLAQAGLYTVLAGHGLAVTRAAETISPCVLGRSRPATWTARPAARRCSATGSASPRPAWPWWGRPRGAAGRQRGHHRQPVR